MKKWDWRAVAAMVIVACLIDASAAPEGRKRIGGGLAFEKMDADGNGEITIEEFLKARAPADDAAKKKMEMAFKKMDADANGKVTKEEFAEWMKNRPSPKQRDAQPPAGGGGGN